MGGDHGPNVTLAACARFIRQYPDAALLLVGQPDVLQPVWAQQQGVAALTAEQVKIVAATEVVAMDDTIETALRRKKDSSMRVAILQVRDGAALEVLKAWNTGHPGGLLTLHANSAADALMRLEDLCMEARATPPKRLIASAVDIIVFIARREGGRVITEILETDEVRGEGA